MTQYCDYTSFEPSNDQWNDWVKGANGQALALGETIMRSSALWVPYRGRSWKKGSPN